MTPSRRRFLEAVAAIATGGAQPLAQVAPASGPAFRRAR